MRKKRTSIGYDLRAMASTQPSGVENYIIELAHQLPAAAPDLDFYFFIDKRLSKTAAADFSAPNASVIRVPVQKESIVWRLVHWHAKRLKLDLFHFPLCVIPTSFTMPAIVTVYDLTYKTHPEFYTPAELELQDTLVAQACRQAAAVLTISKATKRDVERFFQVPAERIHVTYLPVRTNLSTLSAPTVPPAQAQAPYFLAVGNIQPRKNFVRIVQALAALDHPTARLVIVGKKQDEPEFQRLQTAIAEHGLTDRVEIAGHVTDRQLAQLYVGAAALVYPSIAEGFGYPIIEAFAAGTPVITANVSAMAEVAGQAALLVKPESVEQITAAMRRQLRDAKLRQKLRTAGHQRLRQLGQHNLGVETATVYRAVLAGKRP